MSLGLGIGTSKRSLRLKMGPLVADLSGRDDCQGKGQCGGRRRALGGL